MSESQSRYSIVERLTQKKLDIISAKAELQDKLTQKNNSLKDAETTLINWKIDVEEENKRKERSFERDIQKAKEDVDNFNKSIVNKEQVYDVKLAAIESALTSIESISKESLSQNK